MNSKAPLHTPTSPDALYLGMDVGGTKCAALLGNATGEVLDRREWPSRVERGPRAMIDDFLAYARTAPRVVAAGVAIGGPLNAVDGRVLSPPHLPGWTDLPLKAQLEQELGIPVFVEHDAAACALAEYTWGGWRGCHCLADTLFPDAILLGSLARHLGDAWLAQVRARYEAEAHPHARRLCTLQPASLGARVQDLSALVAAMQPAPQKKHETC